MQDVSSFVLLAIARCVIQDEIILIKVETKENRTRSLTSRQICRPMTNARSQDSCCGIASVTVLQVSHFRRLLNFRIGVTVQRGTLPLFLQRTSLPVTSYVIRTTPLGYSEPDTRKDPVVLPATEVLTCAALCHGPCWSLFLVSAPSVGPRHSSFQCQSTALVSDHFKHSMWGLHIVLDGLLVKSHRLGCFLARSLCTLRHRNCFL